MTHVLILQFTEKKLAPEFLESLSSIGLSFEIVSAELASDSMREARAFLLPPEDESEFSFLNWGERYQFALSVLYEAAKLGKPILGMGLGARILIESGLVPGVENDLGHLVKSMSLVQGTTDCEAELNSDVVVAFELTQDYQRNIFTEKLSSHAVLWAPLATRFGRFVITPTLLHEVQNQGMLIFQSISKMRAQLQIPSELMGTLSDSPYGLASPLACSNKMGNVLASVLDFSKSDSAKIVLSAFLQTKIPDLGLPDSNIPLFYFPRPKSIGIFHLKANQKIKLLSSEVQNQKAMYLEKALSAHGLDIQIFSAIYVIHDAGSDAGFIQDEASILFEEKIGMEKPQQIFLIREEDDFEKARKYPMSDERFLQAFEVGEYLIVKTQAPLDFFFLLKKLEWIFGFDSRLQSIYRFDREK